MNSTVPLIGRSGLLGEHQNSEFCDLACGRGTVSSSTYCITHTGLLCQFNSNRQLDLWVDLKVSHHCMEKLAIINTLDICLMLAIVTVLNIVSVCRKLILWSCILFLSLWFLLQTSSARCLSVSEAFVFCGCADGTVRVFSPQNLHYITTLHRPHCLGVDVSQGMQPQ